MTSLINARNNNNNNNNNKIWVFASVGLTSYTKLVQALYLTEKYRHASLNDGHPF